MLIIALATVLLLRWEPTVFFDPAKSLPRDEFWGPLNLDAALSQIASVNCPLTRRLAGDRDRLSNAAVARMVQSDSVTDVACDRRNRPERWRSRHDRTRLSRSRASRHLSSRSVGPTTQHTMDADANRRWVAHCLETNNRATIDVADVEASVRAAWFGRWHLADRISVLNNMVSIRSNASATFWKATHKVTAGMTGPEREEFWTSIQRWLMIDGVAHTTGQSVEVPIQGREAHDGRPTRCLSAWRATAAISSRMDP